MERNQNQIWSPDSQKIVFESNRNGNWDVYIINKDGSGLTQLTNNAANDYYPTWSPDGTKIAFISERSGVKSIWVMNSDGSNQVQVTDNAAGNVKYLDWSPLSNSPPPLTSISVSPSPATVTLGSTQLFTATDQDGNPISVDWSSSDTNVGTVSPATGTSTTFTAQKAGAATVTATSGAVVGSAEVNVSDEIAPTTSISLSGTTGNNGWYTGDVIVALTATDNEGGTGVALTEYNLDGTTWLPYSGSFIIANEGTITGSDL